MKQSMVGNDDIQMKRIELFHYEYLHEERQYLQQKEKEEDYQFSGTQKITPVGYQTGVKISLSVHHEFL